MFSNYKKIYIDCYSPQQSSLIVENIKPQTSLVLFNGKLISDNHLCKYLFRKGIKSIHFESDDPDVIQEKIVKIGKPDLVVSSKPSEALKNLCKFKQINVFNTSSSHLQCNKCGEDKKISLGTTVPLICSERCALIDEPELYTLLKETTIPRDDELTRSFSNDRSNSLDFNNADEPNAKKDKFQKIMLLEAKRHQYMQRKEEYIRNMKNKTFKPYKDPETETKVIEPVKKCKATTKKKVPCKNNALSGSEYCGIVSHRKLDPNGSKVPRRSSSTKYDKLLENCKRASLRRKKILS